MSDVALAPKPKRVPLYQPARERAPHAVGSRVLEACSAYKMEHHYGRTDLVTERRGEVLH